MPELPEVETVMKGLSPVMQGQVIERVICGNKGLRIPFPEGLAARLEGQKIEKLSRRAKYILCTLGNQNILALHLGMSGRVRIMAPRANSLSEPHDHFEIALADGHRIILNDARRFGMVFDLKAANLKAHKMFIHLGPEPLSEEFGADYLLEKLKGRKAPIKTAIMDQKLVVGVGNIYACEALFRSGISPLKKVGNLTKKEAAILVDNIRLVLREAIKAGGSTLKDHRLPDGNFGYFQQSLFVYGREGQSCLSSGCEQEISRITQAGRSTFFCATCQK